MRKHVLLYGLLCGVLIAALQWMEYRWLVIEHSVELYVALVGALFATLGIGLGSRITRTKERLVVREVLVPAPADFVRENTVKTHSSRVFDKLGARRRTQAVQLGKELRLIP